MLFIRKCVAWTCKMYSPSYILIKYLACTDKNKIRECLQDYLFAEMSYIKKLQLQYH